MRQTTFNRQLLGYYYATVLFVALDVGAGINIRLAFLDESPAWRAVYYAFCIGCAALMRWRPDLSVYIGAGEGVVTIFGLVFSMYFGYTLAGVYETRELVEVLLNYAISGYFAYMSWWQGLSAFRQRA